MKHHRQVIVVGGGIMGASAAWHLTQAGAEVTVIERALGDGTTATASSFGWVGASASTPSDNPDAFAARLKAVAEFARVERDVGALPIAARGALLWGATEDATLAIIAEHRAAGSYMACLTRTQILEKAPRLVAPPSVAAWAPDDIAVEPATFAHQLLASAQAAGANILYGEAETIVTSGTRMTGVVVAGQMLCADVVVLANGDGAKKLASTVDVRLPVGASPAVLLRFATEANTLHHLLCVDDLELRPGLDGSLVSAADYPEEGDAGLAALAEQTGSAIAGLLGNNVAPRLLSIHAAQRPITLDKTPLCGFVDGVEGLYALVAHPGVILAPMLGRLCAETVLGMRRR